jgi:methylmalonyl-CoA/ethylmalonyl-CoA epimerase
MSDHAPFTEAGFCHRVAVTVRDIEQACAFFSRVFGAGVLTPPDPVDHVSQDGARLAILWLGNVPLLPLQPNDPNGTVGRYLAKLGPGVHSVAWEIGDLWTTENLLRREGISITGTHIPGRHFFLHPRDTHGLLIEFTDVKIDGDPRRGQAAPSVDGILPIGGVAWVSAVVRELEPVVGQLRQIAGARVLDAAPGISSADTDVSVVRVGDVTLRLLAPTSARSPFFGFLQKSGERFHSIALTMDGFDQVEDLTASAGLRLESRSDIDAWLSSDTSLGLSFQLVDSDSLATAGESPATVA